MIRPKHVRLILPTANKISVTVMSGSNVTAWFDIRSYDIDGLQDEEGIKSATTYVEQLIEAEIKSGFPVMLGGFSQGGALALYAALNSKFKLAGVLLLSCWLPPTYDDSEATVNSNSSDVMTNLNTHFLQMHGDQDDSVPIKYGRLSAEILEPILPNYVFKSFNGVRHTVSSEMISDAMEFLEYHLPEYKTIV